MHQPEEILKKYWGHDSFRPNQKEIISAVLRGEDTLALLPTGGGKSICFQVPALAMPGICLVVTPLISLMKDQVDALKARGIKAYQINANFKHHEIDVLLDNCIYGEIKFLYLSPERLRSDLFKERFKRMKPCLIAVDEAHCISQWGYDFRMAYQEIGEIRKIHPETPVLALTATATPSVVQDIMDNLAFKKKQVIQSSFVRQNLTYAVWKHDDKQGRLQKLLKNIPGSAIVYANTRKQTEVLSHFLQSQGFSCQFYHAGVSASEKQQRQEDWRKGETRIIVATNAFGMGIDKADVRLVVHWNIAANPESYFQEAGRAGRDGQTAYAVVLFNNEDLIKLDEQLESKYPPLEVVRKVYRMLGSYYQLALGSIEEAFLPFRMDDLQRQCQLPPMTISNALNLLERAGYLQVDYSQSRESQIQFIINGAALYEIQLLQPRHEALISLLLRSFSGIGQQPVGINEIALAKKLGKPVLNIKQQLQELHMGGVLVYQPGTGLPSIQYQGPRLDEKRLRFPPEIYKTRKEQDALRCTAIKRYVSSPICRQKQLLSYFGETKLSKCGRCDVCKQTDKRLSSAEFDTLVEQIENIIKLQAVSLTDLSAALPHVQNEQISKVVDWQIDRGLWQWQEHLLALVD